MTKNTKSGITVFIIILLVAAGCVGWTIYEKKKEADQNAFYNNATGNPSGVSSEDITVKSKAGKEYIAALYVEGTIEDANSSYNQSWLLSTINRLKNDPSNAALAMYVNSPGGGVYQADEVYLALKDYKSKGKKFYVYMGPLAASGGYYISCHNKSGELIDATELLDNLGIEIEAIHSGRNKLMGNFYEPITSEQEDIMQSISDECYNQFVGIVANERNMSIAKVKELADGRIYTATQAYNNGLIDSIGSWDNMILELRNVISIPDCKVVTFHYEYKPTFRESLLGMISSIQNSQAASKLGLPSKVMDDLQGFNSYPAYLYK